MAQTKAPKVSYENFCKAFAGVFKKFAYNCGTYHTCYIRGAIDSYCRADNNRRGYLMEGATDEDAVGYRIARSLIVAGWDAKDVENFSDIQQAYVDETCEFIATLERAGYTNEAGFSRHSNGVRYAWLIDGAPSLEEHLEDPDDDDD